MQNSTPASIQRLQRLDGSFPIRSTTRDEAPDSVVLTLHTLLLDLLHDRLVTSDMATKLAQYIANALHLQEFDETLNSTDTRAVFHALAALYEHDPSLISPNILAKSISFLTTHELAAGGPYVNILSRQKIADLATNISISRFIHAVGGPFPALTAYINTASASELHNNQYFSSIWPLELQLTKLRQATGTTPNEDRDIQASTQGSSRIAIWPCRNPWETSESLYGMEALTLARQLPESTSPTTSVSSNTTPARWQKPHALLVKRAIAYYTHDTAISAGIQQALARISRADHSYEIGLLAIRFAQSLKDNRPDKTTLEELGIANLYNWTAYTIYDDILDEDDGKSLLPVANTVLRASVELFCNAVPTKAFKAMTQEAFDTVDAANVWELAHCRLSVADDVITVNASPDYDRLQNLCDRSFTHSLPIQGTLIAAGIPPESDALKATTNAFRQYLIVRQLSDDLHDWQEDIRAGHISYVVSSILRHAGITHGNYNLNTLIPRLEQVHFQKTLPIIAKDMLRRSAKAHKLLRTAKLAANTVIDDLLNEYEQSTHLMLEEHSRVTSFLEAYHP